MKSFIGMIGCTLGNFIYQFLQDDPNYLTSIERSYFMVIAIILIAIINYNPKTNKHN